MIFYAYVNGNLLKKVRKDHNIYLVPRLIFTRNSDVRLQIWLSPLVNKFSFHHWANIFNLTVISTVCREQSHRYFGEIFPRSQAVDLWAISNGDHARFLLLGYILGSELVQRQSCRVIFPVALRFHPSSLVPNLLASKNAYIMAIGKR